MPHVQEPGQPSLNSDRSPAPTEPAPAPPSPFLRPHIQTNGSPHLIPESHLEYIQRHHVPREVFQRSVARRQIPARIPDNIAQAEEPIVTDQPADLELPESDNNEIARQNQLDQIISNIQNITLDIPIDLSPERTEQQPPPVPVHQVQPEPNLINQAPRRPLPRTPYSPPRQRRSRSYARSQSPRRLSPTRPLTPDFLRRTQASRRFHTHIARINQNIPLRIALDLQVSLRHQSLIFDQIDRDLFELQSHLLHLYRQQQRDNSPANEPPRH